MSTTSLDTSGVFKSKAMVKSSKTCLTLPMELVHIRRNGIEFLSMDPIQVWTEMNVNLESPEKSNKLRCTGVVVGCNGCTHSGYLISLIFINLSPQAQQNLDTIAYSRLA